jgi:thioredoxin 2
VPAARLAENPTCGKCHEPLFTGQPAAVDDASFAKMVGKNDIPVVVDFWAEWCGPCKMMAPAFAAAAKEMEPEVRFAKVDTEAARATAARFNIRSIPTLALFRNGEEIARQPGAMSTADIVRWVRSHL